MSTISASMQTSLSALQTNQAAINVTATNIDNAYTEGYSRQQVTIVEQKNYGQLANGTDVQVQRVYDNLVVGQICNENQDLGKYTVEAKYLSAVENVFSDSEDYGLSTAMADFENSWQAVSNNPSGFTERSVLVSDAETMAKTFNTMSADLAELQQQSDDAIVETVDEINQLTQEIAELNEQVARAEAAGRDASSQRDSRDILVQDLSGLIDINKYENSKGQVCIQIADGKPLVEGSRTWMLAAEISASAGVNEVAWVDQGGGEEVITGRISSGELGGLLEVRDEFIPGYQEQLNDLASTLMDEVNALHSSGYDITGAFGEPLFTGTGAADMAVNSEISADPNKIAAAAAADGGPGDGSNAIAISGICSSSIMNNGTASFSEYYHSTVSDVGADLSAAESSFAYQEEMVSYYESYRESISGVSLDEENANLVMYQDAYEAAAKVMSVLEELLDVIMAM